MSPANPFWNDGERLTRVISEVPRIQLGGYVEGHGKELFLSGEAEYIRRLVYTRSEDSRRHSPRV